MTLFEETGTFIYSSWGATYALIFSGDDSFLERCENLCLSLGIVRTNCIRFREQMSYALCSEEKLLGKLQSYFYAELLHNRQVAGFKLVTETDHYYGMTIGYNESDLENRAKQLTQKFWTERVEKKNIIITPPAMTFDGHLVGSVDSGCRMKDPVAQIRFKMRKSA